MAVVDLAVRVGSGPMASSPGGDDNLGLRAVIDHQAAVRGRNCYLADARSRRRLSFDALRRRRDEVGQWLEEHRFPSGSRIGLHVADPLDFAVLYLATVANGRWAVPLDPTAPDRATRAALNRLDPSVVVSDGPPPFGVDVPWAGLAHERLRALDHDDHVDADAGSDRTSISETTSHPAGEPDGGAVLSSSGSTGTPKVIALHQRQLLHGARQVAQGHGLSAHDTGFSPLPLFHVNAEVVGLLATLVSGGGLVLDARFHRTRFWELADEHGVTWVNAVPAIISHLASTADGEAIPDRIRFVRSASAPLPVATLARFESATGIPVIETYGMTEAAGQIAANPLTGPRKPGSVGVPVGIEVRVVDPALPETVSPDPEARPRTGAVEIRGPSVNAAPGSGNGWLRTGDIGHIDGDGYLFLLGRSDDVINRGGEKVFPREIEEVILEEPTVRQAAVVGCPDAALGHVPVAFVTLEGAHGSTAAADPRAVGHRIRARILAALPPGKRPVALHVVAALPTTPTGKLVRRSIDQNVDTLATLSMR